MKCNRRTFVLASAAGALASLPSFAQGTYPARPVRMIVPFPPGQAADIFGRMIADRLSQVWSQNVVVENRAGGGGVPGVLAGKEAAPDGYTLLMGTSGTLGINPVVYSKLPYDAQNDFAPASNVFLVALVLVAHPSFPANSVQALVESAKKAPGKLSFASAGTGTAQHMTAELFKSRAGIDMVHIPYKGSGPAMTDLIGGQVPLMFDSLAAALPHIRGGKVKAIAVTTRQRIPQLPDLPTIAESGYPGFDAAGWSGIVLPAATPRDIVAKVSGDIRNILAEPDFRQKMIDRGGIPDPLTPEQFAAFIRSENVQWGEVARTANVRLDQ
jgi:tripartite-type tricarboxylate transporter receptor subunit TctC